VVLITRECEKSIKLRGTDVTVEKGVQVLVPILALHRDPKYYPDPERFDPERFSEEGKKTRPHFSYIPFGEGPRLCIGGQALLPTGMRIGPAVLCKCYQAL
jgi:cytochrome P450 family 6